MTPDPVAAVSSATSGALPTGSLPRALASVEVDVAQGAQDSPNSLHLGGNASTMRWSHLARDFPAEPGERYRWSGLVRAENVRAVGADGAVTGA